nr:hypothetical protein [Tanacetum cinerariifolium]
MVNHEPNRGSDEPYSDALNAQHQSPKLAPSFANIVQSKSNKRVVKISELRNTEKVDGAAVAIHIEAFEETQNTNLKKEDIKHAPIWVKLHHVPIVAYSEVRAMIEVAEEELKESIMIAILMGNGQGHSLASVDIKYEWTPPMCSLARFLIMARQPNKKIARIKFTKPSLNLQYHRVEKGESYKTNDVQPTAWFENTKLPKINRFTSIVPKPSVTLQNSFSSLDPDGEEAEQPQVTKNDVDLVVNVSDSEVDEEIILDDRNGKSVTKTNLKALFLEDSPFGMSSKDISMREFKESVTDIEVTDVQCTGLQFTWNEKPKVFKPYRIFDHAPLVLNILVLARSKPKPFKFYNLVTHDEKFRDTVMNGWCEHGNLHENVKQLRNKPDAVQACLDDDPFNVDIRDEEASTMAAFNEALLLQEQFLKQKAKVSWLGEGDANTAYFHKAVKSCVSRSRIDVITMLMGRCFITSREFKESVMDIEVTDVHRTGLQFTWNQKPKGKVSLLKKIDRIMANLGFTDEFVGSHEVFKPYRISDHAPLVRNISVLARSKPKLFKFYNLVTRDEKFRDTVMNGWSEQVSDFSIFKVVQKMRHLKKPLQSFFLIREIFMKTSSSFVTNRILDDDPFNVDIRDEEASTMAAFNEALLLQEPFLKQKSKVSWLGEGDANTAYFHKAVKSRVSRSRIDVITMLMGRCFITSSWLIQEIKNAMFSMGNEKALGPDGYTAAFFKELGILLRMILLRRFVSFSLMVRFLKN